MSEPQAAHGKMRVTLEAPGFVLANVMDTSMGISGGHSRFSIESLAYGYRLPRLSTRYARTEGTTGPPCCNLSVRLVYMNVSLISLSNASTLVSSIKKSRCL